MFSSLDGIYVVMILYVLFGVAVAKAANKVILREAQAFALLASRPEVNPRIWLMSLPPRGY